MPETKQQPTRTTPGLAALDAETIARELDWATAANGIRTLRDHGESAAADALALLAAQRDALSREVERLRAQAVADEDAENTASCAQDTRIRELEQENAYLKADTPPYVWMLSDDSPFRRDPELFASSAAAKAKAETDYLTGNYADPASAIAEGDAALEWVPILNCDAEQLLDGDGRTGLIVARVQVKGRMDPAETAAKAAE